MDLHRHPHPELSARLNKLPSQHRPNRKELLENHLNTSPGNLEKTIALLGEDDIGVKSDQVGTHSIRSTFAMILFTHGVEKTTIMRLGRWKSDAVICYIRSQVSGFGKHASQAFQKDHGKDFANFPLFASPPNTVIQPTTPNCNTPSQPNLPRENPTTDNSPKHHNIKYRYKHRPRHRNR